MINLLLVNTPQSESIIPFLQKQGCYNITTYDNNIYILLDILRSRAFDVIVTSDLEGKKFDGIKAIRRYSTTSVVIHISKIKDPDEVVKAFKAGADDYIRMPFGYAEFNSRIQAKYNRCCFDEDKDILRYCGCELWLNTSKLKYKDIIINITSKELQTLEIFFREPKKIFSLDDILVIVYGDANMYLRRCFNNILMRIRKKLVLCPVIEIKYVSRQGYVLVEKKNT